VNSLSTRFNSWRRRRHLQRVAQWEHTRAQGKARFVIRGTLIWSGSMIIFNAVWDYYFHGAVEISKLILFLLVGPIVGLVSWWDNEGVFKAAKIDERMRQIREQNSVHQRDT
jgi:hypothetical protein